MKPDRAIIRTSFPHPVLGNFFPVKLELEYPIGPNETPEEAWEEGRKTAEEWFAAAYPLQESKPEGSGERDLSNWQPGAQRRPETLPTISKDAEKLEIAIDNATTIETLQSIKDQCGKSGLMGQYIAKFNQLNNGFH